MLKVIFAGNWHEAKGYANDNEIPPNQWAFLGEDLRRFKGLRDVEVIRTGSYADRKDYQGIEEFIKIWRWE